MPLFRPLKVYAPLALVVTEVLPLLTDTPESAAPVLLVTVPETE